MILDEQIESLALNRQILGVEELKVHIWVGKSILRFYVQQVSLESMRVLYGVHFDTTHLTYFISTRLGNT